jgi:hypothetical protein
VIDWPVARRVICFTQQVGIKRDFSERLRKPKNSWTTCAFWVVVALVGDTDDDVS